MFIEITGKVKMELLITASVLSVFIMVFYNLYRIDEITNELVLGSKLKVQRMLSHLALVNVVYLVVFAISVMLSLVLLRLL